MKKKKNLLRCIKRSDLYDTDSYEDVINLYDEHSQNCFVRSDIEIIGLDGRYQLMNEYKLDKHTTVNKIMDNSGNISYAQLIRSKNGDFELVEKWQTSRLACSIRNSIINQKNRKIVFWSFIVCALLFTLLIAVFPTKEPDTIDLLRPFSIELQKSNGRSMSAQDLYEDVHRSIVRIEIYSDELVGQGIASGLIVSKDGYIVSCDHIYNGIINPKFKIVTEAGSDYEAVFVAADKEADISILKIIGSEQEFQPVTFADSENIKPGENCYVLGFPGNSGVDPIITSGIISAINIEVAGSLGYTNTYIQTCTPANPGNSGGGLFNASGNVIGLVAAKYTAENYENTTYCVPSRTIQSIVYGLLDNNSVERVMLGVTVRAVTNAELDNGMPFGSVIVAVSETSPMSNFTKPEQVIVELNGVSIARDRSLYSILAERNPDDLRMRVKLYDPETSSYYEVEFDAKTRTGENSYRIVR